MLNTLLPNPISKTPGKNIKLRLLRRDSALLLKLNSHPLKPGRLFKSPGGIFTYRVIGACCRLYDRENLPHLCCSLEWHGKQPSWRRIGKRFVPDIAVKHSPSYCVQLMDYPGAEPVVMTLYWVKLSDVQHKWWYARRIKSAATTIQAISTNGQCEENNTFTQKVA